MINIALYFFVYLLVLVALIFIGAPLWAAIGFALVLAELKYMRFLEIDKEP